MLFGEHREIGQLLLIINTNLGYPLERILCRLTSLASLAVWPFYELPSLPSYFSASGRIILIGDAAHAIPPTGGQGAKMALEDAGTLANALALSFKGSPNKWNVPHLESLSQWQNHRQERIAKIAEFSARGGDMRRATTSVWQQVLRDWTLWMVFRWAGSAERMKWIYECKVEDAYYE